MLDRRSALKTGAAALAVSAVPVAAAPTGAAGLNALFDQFMKENLDLSPVSVTALGLDTGARAAQKSLIDDTSLAGIAKLKDVQTSQLKQLKAFPRSSVTGMDQLNYDVVLYAQPTGDDAARSYNSGSVSARQSYIRSQL